MACEFALWFRALWGLAIALLLLGFDCCLCCFVGVGCELEFWGLGLAQQALGFRFCLCVTIEIGFLDCSASLVLFRF